MNAPKNQSQDRIEDRKKKLGALGWVACLTVLMVDVNISRFSTGPVLITGMVAFAVVAGVCYYILKKS